jgi:N-acetylglucosamine-6-sulfatase
MPPPRPSPLLGPLRRAAQASPLASASLAVVVATLCLATPAAAQEEEPPSILLIVTDDQRWDTLWAMPEVQRSLVERGVTFSEAFTTSSLCCPSRASILTGQYPHTTGVYRQGLPHGGFQSFDDTTTIATALRAGGYRTGFFGKYLDAYQSGALGGYVPPGWDHWVAFVHSEYFEYALTIDGTIERFAAAAEDYSTDVLAARTEEFIRSTDGPVFAVYAPPAPHAPAIPSPVDGGLFADLPPWRPPSFDEPDVSDKPAHVRAMVPFDPDRTERLDILRIDQYRTLQAVDRSIGRLLGALGDTGRLEDAVVIFTSDNGLLWGEHRWAKKEVPYEEAIRVPLVIRADRIGSAVGRTDPHLVANIDLAPTIAAAAGVPLPGADGRSLLPLLEGRPDGWRQALLIEHMRGTNPIPTYCAVRTSRYLYAVYDTGERELYDLAADPYQLRNLSKAPPGLRTRLQGVLDRLCEPPPPGFREQMGLVVSLLAIAGVAALAVAARSLLARSARVA